MSQERVWNEILRIREFVRPFIMHYDMLHPSEYAGRPRQEVTIPFPEVSSGEYMKLAEANVPAQDIMQIRPFIGEELWFVYWSYRVVALRLALNVVRDIEKGTLQTWDKDPDGEVDPVREVLADRFDPTELTILIDSSPFGAPQRILTALEDKILAEMNTWLFGRQLADITIAERERIASLIPSVEHTKA